MLASCGYCLLTDRCHCIVSLGFPVLCSVSALHSSQQAHSTLFLACGITSPIGSCLFSSGRTEVKIIEIRQSNSNKTVNFFRYLFQIYQNQIRQALKMREGQEVPHLSEKQHSSFSWFPLSWQEEEQQTHAAQGPRPHSWRQKKQLGLCTETGVPWPPYFILWYPRCLSIIFPVPARWFLTMLPDLEEKIFKAPFLCCALFVPCT